MLNISEIIKKNSPKKVEKSQRAEIIKQIYALYTSPTQNKLRRIENWKRYCTWCRENNLKFKVKVNQEKFRKHKSFIKQLTIKAFCVKISHIKTPDLWYCLSEAKDRNNRNQSIAQFLL